MAFIRQIQVSLASYVVWTFLICSCLKVTAYSNTFPLVSILVIFSKVWRLFDYHRKKVVILLHFSVLERFMFVSASIWTKVNYFCRLEFHLKLNFAPNLSDLFTFLVLASSISLQAKPEILFLYFDYWKVSILKCFLISHTVWSWNP